MDVLSDILSTVKLQGSLYFHTVFTPPWAIQVPAFENAARFHLVTRGTCWVGLENAGPIALSTGDMILIPGGSPHRLSDAADRPAAALDRVIEESGFTGEGALVYGGGDAGIGAKMVCGHFAFAPGADHPLLRSLPKHLLVTADMRSRHSWLDDAMRFVAREAQEGQPGSAATINRLSEVLFIEAIRAHAAELPAADHILFALSDPRLGRALSAIHRAPENEWTLDSLAAEAAMSRSRFAERFRELMGIAPAAYLQEWRLQKARDMLAEGRQQISDIARSVGYRSPAAFSRAFAETFGCPPAQFRKRGARPA